MGYWTSDNMNALIREYIELFEFLFPNHVMLLNMDWSSNHAAMAPDARTISNMRVLAGGERKVNDVVEPMPVFPPYVLTEEDIGPAVPQKWQDKIKPGNKIYFKYKHNEEPFYGLQSGQTKSDVKGVAIGKRELAHRLGWWVEGMTEKGKAMVKHASLIAPSKFQSGDLVFRVEKSDDGDEYHLYKIVSVPVNHTDAKSPSDNISCQWFRPISGEENLKFSMTNEVYNNDTFKAKTMNWVDPRMVNIVSGSLKNKVKCELEFDLDSYWKIYFSTSEDKEDDDLAELITTEDVFDPTSLNSVLGRLPMFLSTKSVLEEIVSEAGHILLLSSKYHAECAGQGIEYCFGRTKWWFKKHNRCSTEHLRKGSKDAFSSKVVTIDHVRKFARKNRDYQRVYRAGATGLATDSTVKKCKTHRNMTDCTYTFITE